MSVEFDQVEARREKRLQAIEQKLGVTPTGEPPKYFALKDTKTGKPFFVFVTNGKLMLEAEPPK